MSDKKKNEGSGAGTVVGFQIPMAVKQRKEKVDELLAKYPDISEGDVLGYWNGMSDDAVEQDARDLDSGNCGAVADRIRIHVVREVVRRRIKEVVRKKPGGGGYVLYSPNKGKKHPAKAVGTFPTQLGAKRAELARFPPKDPGKLQRLRKQVDRLTKDPKKAADAARKDAEVKKPRSHKGAHHEPSKKKESIEIIRSVVSAMIKESLFREEKTGSNWDDQLRRLSKGAIQADSKLQSFMKKIEQKTEKVLQDAFSVISKNVDKKVVKLKNHGIKKAEAKGATYLAFTATMDEVECGPIYIYVEAGTPRIEVSEEAKVALTKTDPDNAKLFRAELVTVQERVLDKMDDLEVAVIARDKYLAKAETEVDKFVSGLSPLQVSLLKSLLIKKYRKIG